MRHDKAVSAARSLWSLRRHVSFPAQAVFLIAIVLVTRSFVLLVTPWPLKLIIDSVIYQKPLWHWLSPWVPDPLTHRMRLLNVLGLAMLGLGAAENALAYQGDRLLLMTGQKAVFQLRRVLFGHLERLSLSFHRRQRIGDLMSRLGGDINALQDFVVNVGAGVFAHLFTIGGMAMILITLDWRYAFVVVASVPPLLWVTQRYSRNVKAALRRARKKESEVWSMVQEVLSAIHVVQAYTREGIEERRFAERVEDSLAITLEATSLQLQLPRLVGSVFAVATALTLWFGAMEVLKGVITAGELLVFLAYLRGMATPVRQIARTVSSVGKAEVAGERIADLLAETNDIQETSHPRVLTACRGDLEFRGVSFGYMPGCLVVKDLWCRIPAGQTVALVGPTGAGKSTIASLVPRFYDPNRGQVLLDGVDIREFSLDSLRRHIALVTQEPILFSGPVWRNIAYGRPQADRAAAIAAARAVGVDDVIQSLPGGYDTEIGERGATVSGGQRQCIAAARAMLRNASVVILDEPTSSLDTVTEFWVAEALKRLTVGRTTLMIAHRLTTIAAADTIYVIDGGRIVEQGSHEQLLGQGGHYATFWHKGDRSPSDSTLQYADSTPE